MLQSLDLGRLLKKQAETPGCGHGHCGKGKHFRCHAHSIGPMQPDDVVGALLLRRRPSAAPLTIRVLKHTQIQPHTFAKEGGAQGLGYPRVDTCLPTCPSLKMAQVLRKVGDSLCVPRMLIPRAAIGDQHALEANVVHWVAQRQECLHPHLVAVLILLRHCNGR